MSNIVHLQNRHFAGSHRQFFLLLSTSSHAELYEHLAKTLYYMLAETSDPVVIYQRLPTNELQLAYTFPLASMSEQSNRVPSICSTADFSSSTLAYHALKDKNEVLGYAGYSPPPCATTTSEIETLIDIAAHQWRLLNAKQMADQ